MNTLRFGLITLGLFALAFVGVTWMKAGFPLTIIGVAELKPNPKLPVFEEATKMAAREGVAGSNANDRDGHVEHDRLRRELQQASTEFNVSSCNYTVRTRFVDALTNYVTAWHDMAFCKPGVADCPNGDDARLERAATAFRTPSDRSTQDGVREALMGAGGVSPEDFPDAIRSDVFRMFQFRQPRSAATAADKRSDRRRFYIPE